MAQESALRDALMMKLVSYYEDKYKLTNPKTSTWLNKNYVIADGDRRRHEVSDIEETYRISTTVSILYKLV